MSEEMQKHTPGPWIIIQVNEDHPGVDGLNGEVSIVIFGIKDANDDGGVRGRTDAEGRANARLIAAAPDLLEALRSMVELFDSEIHSEYDGTSLLKGRLAEADFARQVIAQAEGRAA